MTDVPKLKDTIVSWIQTETETTVVFTYGKSFRMTLGNRFGELDQEARETVLDVVSADAVLKLLNHFVLPNDAFERKQMFEKIKDLVSDEDRPTLKGMIIPGTESNEEIVDLLRTLQNKAKQ